MPIAAFSPRSATASRAVHTTLRRAALCAALGLGAIAAPAHALVVPNALASVEGNSNNAFPFIPDPLRSQQVYEASQFAGFDGPLLLTRIAFRPDAADGAPHAWEVPEVRINLSTTQRAADGLSTTFADNLGSDDTEVYRGALSLATADLAGPGGTRVFDILITFAVPFLYDPARGNLLLDIRSFGDSDVVSYDAHNLSGDAISRVFGELDAASGIADSSGLVTAFDFVAATVPAPGTLILLLAGALALHAGRRRAAGHPSQVLVAAL